MTEASAAIAAVNALSPFNSWAGFEVESAGDGAATLRLTDRSELRQHAGFLHAGVVAALLDTAAGFAAATVAGNVATSQMSVSFLAPARGEVFLATARVLKAGKRQVFVAAELHAEGGALVANATAVLVPLG